MRYAGWILLALVAACSDAPEQVPVPGADGRTKTAADARATRRAFDGAPPVIPHASFGASCTECHTEGGIEVEGVGFAPPSPHDNTGALSNTARCRQCHVFARDDVEPFVANDFHGLEQDLRHGSRAYDGAPPVMPHPILMRENCAACHTGPAAREEIRTSHPERSRCVQCHLPVLTDAEFSRS